MLGILNILDRDRRALTVELGAGASTHWIAAYLRHAGDGPGRQFVSLEHNEAFQAMVSQQLPPEARAGVRLAPLEQYSIEGEEYRWYARAAWKDLAGIDFLLVDGPPGVTGPLARFPAVPLLWDALNDGAWVALDDYPRPDEQAISQRWLELKPGQLEFVLKDGRTALFRVCK
jgi:hypothetical protein